MKPIERYGYDSVGPGWKFILEALDSVIVSVVDSAKNRAKNRSSAPDPDDIKINVDQVKEKFGGLRVYITPINMFQDLTDEVNGAILMAEHMAVRVCEQCGSLDDVINRGIKNVPHSWTKTFCAMCHTMREKKETTLEGGK